MRHWLLGLVIGSLILVGATAAHAACVDTCDWVLKDGPYGSKYYDCDGECSGSSGEYNCLYCVNPFGGAGTPCYCLVD